MNSIPVLSVSKVNICFGLNAFMRTLLKLAQASWIIAVFGLSITPGAAKPKHLLVVTATQGFRHSSIPTAENVLATLGERTGLFTVDYVRGGPDGKADQDVREKMSGDALKKYDGVIFA